MAQVSVSINGKLYRIACDDGQEGHLNGLAEKLDRTITDMRGAFGEIGDQRLTVMAAIMVMDEAAETERRLRAAEADLEALSESRSALASRRIANEAAIARRVTDAAQRIEQLAGILAGRTQIN